MSMRSWKAVFLPMIASLLLAGAVLPAAADSGGVTRFATLPQGGPSNPEGLAADAAGNIYVATFDFDTPNVIYVFSRSSGPPAVGDEPEEDVTTYTVSRLSLHRQDD